MDKSSTSPSRSSLLVILMISASTLAFEIDLTRLFSVAQFYHFAFMIVSIALLGFSASGTFLAIIPKIIDKNPRESLGWLSLATSSCFLGSYFIINWLPFDSFSIAWDRDQVLILILHYLALSSPFFFGGLAVGILLTIYPQAAGTSYAANLMGSALGCIVALATPKILSGEGIVVICSGLAALASLICIPPVRKKVNLKSGHNPIYLKISFQNFPSIIFSIFVLCILIFTLRDFGLRLKGRSSLSWLNLRLSPYKSLSYALQYPDAQVIYSRWNSFSRIDLVHSSGIRSMPGLSYRYLEIPPPQNGLFLDGDEPSPVVLPGADLSFNDYLPGVIAFHLRPAANVLILEPRGGLDILTALNSGATQVTAVEINPLIVEAAQQIYSDPRIHLFIESDRSYLQSSAESYDVVVLSLANSYHPVRSGAYSLGEDYRYTVEAFQEMLDRLNSGGLLVVTRWLQTPPSESLRAFALAVTSLERSGANPRTQIVAFRGYNTSTLLVKNGDFTPDELLNIRQFATKRAFDLTYAPDIHPDEVNQYNISFKPIEYQTFTALLNTYPRESFYTSYPYDVSPPTDDHPFFGHFFKWSQTRQVLTELGKTWQPFGGAGYFVILALLLLSTFLAGILILLPVGIVRWRSIFLNKSNNKTPGASPKFLPPPSPKYLIPFIYFCLLGLAYLCVEISLIQRFILFLSNPTYAFTGVLFSILLFSGLGSRFSKHIPIRLALPILVLMLFVESTLLPEFFEITLGLPLIIRMGLTTLVLAPIGFLMGLPFPSGIQRLSSQNNHPMLIPWIWAVNGATSVVASILASLLVLTFGLHLVLQIGAVCYAGSWLAIMALKSPHPA
jgi:hypothetical protein